MRNAPSDDEVFISPSERRYTSVRRLPDGDTYDRWSAVIHNPRTQKPQTVLVRRAGNVALNEYATREARILEHVNAKLAGAKRPIRLLVPELIETFEVDGLVAVVTDFDPKYYTLEEIHAAYPDGVPAPHVAWIFNRMLAALMTTHSTGVVHGAVLPCNMLIYSGKRDDDMRHTGVLTEWLYAVLETAPNKNEWPGLTAWNEAYREFYPSEVERRKPVTPATDLAMAAGCALYLLGGNVASGEVPNDTPWGMAQLLRSCRDRNPDRRPRDLVAFHRQFQRMLEQEFGPPVFRELPLPSRS